VEAPADSRPAPPRKPDEGDHRRLLASAEKKYEVGRFADAIADYRRAVAIRASGPALVGLSRALYDSNRPGEALRSLEQAIQGDGRYAPAWLLLGEIHQAEGRNKQAKAAYERFLQLEPRGEQSQAVREIIAKQLQ
jgi:tetratricopeptide (TPR) repeat protein